MSDTKHIYAKVDRQNIVELMSMLVTEMNEMEKGKANVEETLRKLLKEVDRMKRKGGITLVSSDDTLITTFTLNSYRRKLRSKNGRIN